ncbi:hypothetical protein ACFOJ6_16580 [Gordonia humi]
MRGQLIYAADLFDRSTAEAMVERYLRILTAVVDDPDIVVGDIALHDETAQVADVDAGPQNLSEVVAEAAARLPDAVAIDRHGTTVTFAAIMSTIETLEAVMPGTDRDSLLTMTVMSSVPGLAEAGPDELDVVLQGVRANATPDAANAH